MYRYIYYIIYAIFLKRKAGHAFILVNRLIRAGGRFRRKAKERKIIVRVSKSSNMLYFSLRNL